MKDCQVFILLGQSQAVGHGIPMDEQDKIKTPLKNVFGLSRQSNQSFDLKELIWEGYTSHQMNLAEEQDHTYSLANCLATLWQKEIDDGADLPDLYIIHIAIGAEGVTDKYFPNGESRKYMWNPSCNKKLIPGKLGTVDISLYPFTLHILSLLKDSFRKLGKKYKILNLYWRGGENDIETPVETLKAELKPIYEKILFGCCEAIGYQVPITLNRIVSFEAISKKEQSEEFAKSLTYINTLFDELSRENENISIFDSRCAPFYKENESRNGLFVDDMVHYQPQVNWWNAQKIIESAKEKSARNRK